MQKSASSNSNLQRKNVVSESIQNNSSEKAISENFETRTTNLQSLDTACSKTDLSLDKIIADSKLLQKSANPRLKSNQENILENSIHVKHRQRWFDKFDGEPPTYSAHY